VTDRQFDNSKVLVVGGAGFVGSNLVKMLIAGSASVGITVVDNFLSSEPINFTWPAITATRVLFTIPSPITRTTR
jgi:nucleoside-diphosphate-sugar epimerase